MNEVKRKMVELVGGPLDGERVVLLSHITEFQKARTVGSYYVYRETVYQSKDGEPLFEYAGIGY